MRQSRPNLLNFFYLLSSGLFISLLGTVYRIWLARKIGPEGLGIFQMTYPVYRLLSGVAALGLPMALTKWVAEYLAGKEFAEIIAFKKWAVKIVAGSSLATMGLLIAATPFLSKFPFTDPRVLTAFYIVAPAIPFSALAAIYRGYYQGFSLMAPTAVSEVAEQLMEIGVTWFGLTFFLPFHPDAGFIYPVLGLTAGEVTCLISLLFFNRAEDSIKRDSPVQPTFSGIEALHFSWPLLLNQITVAAGLAGESVLIPHLLMAKGYSVAQSTKLFGVLEGMASPVAFFPLIFIFPLATVLAPQVSSAKKTRAFPTIRAKLIRFYCLAVIISSVGGLLIYHGAPALSFFLYQSYDATTSIQLLVFGLPFTALASLNITVLRSVGRCGRILTLSLWGIGLEAAGLIILTLHYGINGAALAIIVTQIFMFLASLTASRDFRGRRGQNSPKLPPPSRFPDLLR